MPCRAQEEVTTPGAAMADPEHAGRMWEGAASDSEVSYLAFLSDGWSEVRELAARA